ncbi:GIY-YIG nuclease family protein [Sphingobacterium spiritivorum]|uniref:GIY-YIG nuclease family protein n=1 Tax=Sphingobacterium spiritivorum TaxID=258 RepID=UPI003DA34086
MYFLYILYSVQADRYYIGVTHDPEGRLRRHNSHYKKGFTGGFTDWCIVYQECYETKNEALVSISLTKPADIDFLLTEKASLADA